MLHSEGSDVRILIFRVNAGVSSEDLAQTDGVFRVLYEQHFVGVFGDLNDKDECNIVLRFGYVVRCVSMQNIFF